MLGTEAIALLEAMDDPAMVLESDGSLLRLNRATKRLLGISLAQKQLSDLVVQDNDAAQLYLKRCAGSGQPLIGRLSLSVQGRTRKFQCKGSAFSSGEDRVILLRILNTGVQPFVALNRTIAELKDELQKRRHYEAMLEETVRDRELLHCELEHRVKNNMQMLSALLTGAERETESSEAKAALKDASLRFAAVSSVQQLLYRSDTLSTVCSQALVSTLVRAVSSMAPDEIEITAAVDPIALPIHSAVSIGQMLNELLTNAVKYGHRHGEPQKLSVEFARHADQIKVALKDNGPGFELPETGKRASGIGLVRGLLRQVGGSIRVEQVNGTCCVVTFPEPLAATSGSSQ